MRKTAKELVLENYVGTIKEVAHKHGLKYANEPYDMNPAGDIDLGSVADIPTCEFWNANGGGLDTLYSCIEAVSIAHTMGKSQVNAEAFTTRGKMYLNYPDNMKNQTDWAFAMGINGIIFHTFQHQPLGEEVLPGMTMGPYGVQWNRNRTMWHLFPSYHEYITRCSNLLRQGDAVADILYLTPESAPQVFSAPRGVLKGSGLLKDKKGYRFDAVTPRILTMRATVEDGKIAFPGGTRYSLLVLPNVETMTPETLSTIVKLVKAGATVVGNPPRKSPSLVGYPECDRQVKKLARDLWGKDLTKERKVGRGRVILNTDPSNIHSRKKEGPSLLPMTGNWIWFNKGNPAKSAVPGNVYFKHTFNLADNKTLAGAKIEATADNSFTLQVNGRKVLSGNNFNKVFSTTIRSELRDGNNTLTVRATNDGNGANPAGFIAAMLLHFSDGTSKTIATDDSWKASLDENTWAPAKTLGPGNMSPWGLTRNTSSGDDTLYPDYEKIASLLNGMGIPEDFQSDAPSATDTAGRRTRTFFLSPIPRTNRCRRNARFG